MSEAENQLRSDIAEGLLRFGETTESDKEYLLKAYEALSDELDKIEERMEEAGLTDELAAYEDFFDHSEEDDDDEDDDDPYGLFAPDMYSYDDGDDPEDY